MQTDLRWIIFCVGVVFLGWIAWDAYQKTKRIDRMKALESLSKQADPLLEEEKAVEEAEIESDAVIAFSIMAYKPQMGFMGTQLHAAIQHCMLRWEPSGFYVRESGEEIWYRIANVRAPGTFALATRHTDIAPGIILFMGGDDMVVAIDVFEDMLSVAKRLAKMLEGELCDANRRPLTVHRIEQMRVQVRQLESVMLSVK